LWLNQESRHIAVVHCLDGKAVSATAVVAFLAYARVIENPSQGVRWEGKGCRKGGSGC
jgi:hypothetical protein